MKNFKELKIKVKIEIAHKIQNTQQHTGNSERL
jgi:hypothetical protein